MKLHVACLTAAILLAASLSWAAEHTKDSFEVIRKNLADKKAVLVDVREQREWDRGHLKDARLFPISKLNLVRTDEAAKQDLAEELPKDLIIYCHCARGARALLAGEFLEARGYDVRPLAAGFDELREAGFEAEKPEKK